MSVSHCSLCSIRRAVTRRSKADSEGKIRATRVRRFSSLLRRLRALVVRSLRRCVSGRLKTVSASGTLTSNQVLSLGDQRAEVARDLRSIFNALDRPEAEAQSDPPIAHRPSPIAHRLLGVQAASPSAKHTPSTRRQIIKTGGTRSPSPTCQNTPSTHRTPSAQKFRQNKPLCLVAFA